jgi:hypothetical protein
MTTSVMAIRCDPTAVTKLVKSIAGAPRDILERLAASLNLTAEAGVAQAALEEGQHIILVFWIVCLESLGGQPRRPISFRRHRKPAAWPSKQSIGGVL